MNGTPVNNKPSNGKPANGKPLDGEVHDSAIGIVRPADIAVDNSIPSYKVADARITYSGNGVVPDANRAGLISRFFMKFWPL